MICDVLAISSVQKGDVGCENTGFAGKKENVWQFTKRNGKLGDYSQRLQVLVPQIATNRWANVG